MKRLIRFALANPVAANLLFVVVLVSGGLAGSRLPREVFPEFSKAAVSIDLFYPNASPEEVERGITIPVEEAADGLQGTYEIRSISSQGGARVFVTLQPNKDVQVYLDELRQAMDAIQGWPEDAEDPVAKELKLEFPVLTVSLFGNLEREQVFRFAEGIRDQFKKVVGVSTVVILGNRDREIRVVIRPEELEKFGLSLREVSSKLKAQVLDLPGGSLETEAGEIRLRILGEETDAVALGEKAIHAFPDGTLVRLRDIAHVTVGLEKPRVLSRYNGFPTVSLQIAKDKSGDVIDIVNQVEAIVASERPNLPIGMSIGVSSDFSIYVKNRLRTLMQSGMFGLALVLLILWLFLDAKVALMTAMGIPMAVAGGMILMGSLGITMNMLSMFSFILVLGLVVDDAIVVAENSFRYFEKGFSPKEAALLGASEVAWPVLVTVATTISAFAPMLMIEGGLGQWMTPVPWVASLTLLASLLEALVVLPVHFSEWVTPLKDDGTQPDSKRKRRARWYDRAQSTYENILISCIRHRYAVVFGAFGLASLAGTLFVAGHLKFVMMPKFEAKLFMVNVETPTSSSLAQTSLAMRPFEQAIANLPNHEKESFITIVGANYSDQQNYNTGAHLGQLMVELSEGQARTRTTEEIQESLRVAFGKPPGVQRIGFTEPQAGPPGKPIELHLISVSGIDLPEASFAIQKFLTGFPGVRDVRDNQLPGARELQVRLTEEGRMLGFSEADIGRQVLGAFYGDRASVLRLGRNPANLLVRYPEEARLDFRAIREMRVHSPSGESVLLERVASLQERQGLLEIPRRNRGRAITVTADVTLTGNASDTIAAVMKEFGNMEERWPGVSLNYGGDQARQRESIGSLFRAMGISAMLIFCLLVLLFRSYLQPFVVLSSVPFAGLGVMFGFACLNVPISFMTLLGMMALGGIAVNDALVLQDFINQHRRKGHAMIASVLRAGSVRMRPVLLTSLTTIGGLMPLAFFASGQARFLAPMAMALVFGMISATVMTLILIPSGYVILEDFYAMGRRLKAKAITRTSA